jgi:nucleoside-diphosphate-sugar epimerase
MTNDATMVHRGDRILVTGATGFLGSRVVDALLRRGFRNIRCLARRSSDLSTLTSAIDRHRDARVEVVQGTLLSRDDCDTAAVDVTLVYHLAAGTHQKSFADAFLNSVVGTRNLLDAALRRAVLTRFVNVSSFAVYTNRDKPRRGVLDETCPVEDRPEVRGEAYCYAKVKQDQLVMDYGRKYGVPFVLVRPGVVYGPGARGISGRVGSGALGVFLHFGGSNVIPFTYVDNCADAIALAGIVEGVDRETFNIVDDDLPTSRQFLRLYKRHIKSFVSLPVPRPASYLLSVLWQRYSEWSRGQLPPTFNRSAWHAYWKGSHYTNAKAKTLLGWRPTIPTDEGMKRYIEAARGTIRHGA